MHEHAFYMRKRDRGLGNNKQIRYIKIKQWHYLYIQTYGDIDILYFMIQNT